MEFLRQDMLVTKKTPVLEFFLKKQRLRVFKKGLHQSFFPVKFVNFSEQLFSRTTFGECFCFRGWPCAALSKQ